MPDPAPIKPPALKTDGNGDGVSRRDAPAPHALDYLGPRRSRLTDLLDHLPTGEQVFRFIRTLLWVAPLTLLIWIYAEREQSVTVPGTVFPIGVQTTAADRVVTLRYPQDHNMIVELSGPRVQIDRVREQLLPRDGGAAVQLMIDPQLRLGGQQLPALAQLNNHPLFKNNGITIKSCNPSYITVDIDKLEERTAVVRPPADLQKLLAEVHFEPETVTVRAPSQYFENAPKEDGVLFVTAEFAKKEDLKSRTGPVRIDKAPLTWYRKENVTILEPAVRADLTINPQEARYVIPKDLPIYKLTPAGLEKDLVVNYKDSISNVGVVGAPEGIEAIRKGNFVVTATLYDLNPLRDPIGVQMRKPLKFDLPPGVRLDDQTAARAREWDVTLERKERL